MHDMAESLKAEIPGLKYLKACAPTSPEAATSSASGSTTTTATDLKGVLHPNVVAWKMVAADDACEAAPCEEEAGSHEVLCTDTPIYPTDEGCLDLTLLLLNSGLESAVAEVKPMELPGTPSCVGHVRTTCPKMWPGDDVTHMNQEGEWNGQRDELNHMEDFKTGGVLCVFLL
ncbi:hypothetical protein Pelo_6183 [Pelomyxa schiedti]|nr:hypothetical protein Pelo_6183 [Pelomyxa schiedti]